MFTGFSDATVDFLWGIRFNNEKPWFEEHKEIYLKELYQPMRAIGEELYEYISDQRPDYGLILRVARIYREARRLHGRGPYKDNLWLSIERPAELWTANTCFWFGVHPEGWTYGMGYWMPKPATMAKLRRRIDADPKPMEELMRRLAGQEEFQLEMEQYKKPRAAAPQRAGGALVSGEKLLHRPRGALDRGALQPRHRGADEKGLCIFAPLL